MCGRFVVARATSELAPLFEVDEVDDAAPGPSFNFAPSERVGVVLVAKDGRRLLTGARWGLVARFKRSLRDGPTPFNARMEKLFSSGMYRPSMAKRRAIIPADGFYERRKSDRQSFYVHPGDGGVLGLAGLYEWWSDPAKASDDPTRRLLSVTIITRPPQGEMVQIHDRQPLYLAPGLYDDWLDPDTEDPRGLLDAAMDASGDIAAGLDFRPVRNGWLTTVPGLKRDDPALIES
jgi:putative SOS response-associated peptidase YedK